MNSLHRIGRMVSYIQLKGIYTLLLLNICIYIQPKLFNYHDACNKTNY